MAGTAEGMRGRHLQMIVKVGMSSTGQTPLVIHT
jgi:hypothetical protein